MVYINCILSALMGWFAARRTAEELAGYREGRAKIERLGVDRVAEDLDWDFALGMGWAQRSEGVLRAVAEARAAQGLM